RINRQPEARLRRSRSGSAMRPVLQLVCRGKHMSTHSPTPSRRPTPLAPLFTAASLLLGGAALADTTVRIGFQKSSTLTTLLRSQGTLEKALAEQGVTVSWHEFPSGLPDRKSVV